MENQKTMFNLRDLEAYRNTGSLEKFLGQFSESSDCLLHGSGVPISGNILKPGNDGNLYATNVSGIALLKALLSNKGLQTPGLQYPYVLTEDSPLTVRVHGMHPKTIRQKGFVYVVPETEREKFKNVPEDSWQYVSREPVEFIARIEVSKKDFVYPIFDVHKRTWVQE